MTSLNVINSLQIQIILRSHRKLAYLLGETDSAISS